MPTSFSSAGFDLDALPGSGNAQDVVFEVGGSATTTVEPVNDESPIAQSEKLKGEGNEAFKKKKFLDACDMYTSAIESCPGMSGTELLAMQEDFDAKEREKHIEQSRQEMIARGKKHPSSLDDQEKLSDEPPPLLRPESFEAPPHPHGHNLAIYHCNRAACMMHLENYEDSVKDCNIAILLRPDWSKAFVRRSAAYEKMGKTEIALSDATKALELDPHNAVVKKTVARLQKMENERMEKLKEETMGKLKDLGNSLLSNFGLSLDNFQAKQDANGSYNISFNQNK